MGDTLVIVPCGESKIWDRNPDYGAAKACDAYTSSLFRLNSRYATLVSDRWYILSAKYGFIEPEFTIPGPYNVSFKRKASQPVSIDELRKQVESYRLAKFSTVIGLGGKDYRAALLQAFEGRLASLTFPFAGLDLFQSMKAVKQVIRQHEERASK